MQEFIKTPELPDVVRPYPPSFEPNAIWNVKEICEYLNIKVTHFYEIEAKIPTFKSGQKRVAFAKDVIAYAERLKAEQNPHFKKWVTR